MYMYVYVCICMYMYVYVCICMYMYVYVCICMYMYVYVCIYIYMIVIPLNPIYLMKYELWLNPIKAPFVIPTSSTVNSDQNDATSASSSWAKQ